MSTTENDAIQLAARITSILADFERSSGHHQRDESFVAVDDNRYTVSVKLRSPFGNGQSCEVVESTNELQQRINYWLSIQRELGSLAAIRLTITPMLDDKPEKGADKAGTLL